MPDPEVAALQAKLLTLTEDLASLRKELVEGKSKDQSKIIQDEMKKLIEDVVAVKAKIAEISPAKPPEPVPAPTTKPEGGNYELGHFEE